MGRATALHGNRYDYSRAVYRTNHEKLAVICPTHGKFMIRPDKHMGGQGCRRCAGERLSRARRFSCWDVIGRFFDVHGFGRYQYDLRDYVNLHEPLRIRCPRHGWFAQSAAAHLRGHGCAKCSSPRGEKRIRRVLRELGQEFREQVRFPNCRDKRTLPFDFYVPGPRLLIEYDGRQHFQKSQLWGGHHQLERTKRHDAIRDRFAAENGFPFIRIPYWEFDHIEEILRAALGDQAPCAA